jgi:hypothetical protein
MKSNFYREVLDSFVEQGWAERYSTEGGYAYYAIRPVTTIDMLLAQETQATYEIDREVGTYYLE